MLAAGAGTRLRPLTGMRPKALCPVANVALVDHALARLAPVAGRRAVNAHHARDAMEAHLAGRVHLSVEDEEGLGTAGALGVLRPWIDGAPVLVTNADAWLPVDLAPFVAGWDRERVRLLTVRDAARGDFGPLRYCGAALLPWREVAALEAVPSGLYEVSWGRLWSQGALDLVEHDGPFVDCGTVHDYLRANLLATDGRGATEPGAQVASGAVVERSVVWAGSRVLDGEVLVDAVRAGHVTVLVR